MARDGTESPDSFWWSLMDLMASPIYDRKRQRIGCAIPLIWLHFFWYLEWYLEPVLSQLLPEISGSFLQLSWGIIALFHLAKCVLKPVGRIHPIHTDHHWSTGCHRISLGILHFFWAVWPHLWCRWITITRSPVKGRTQHVGKLMVGSWPMPRSACWTCDLCMARCGAKLLHKLWLGWKSDNTHSYKFTERQGMSRSGISRYDFDTWVFLNFLVAHALPLHLMCCALSCYQWSIMGGIQVVALKIFLCASMFWYAWEDRRLIEMGDGNMDWRGFLAGRVAKYPIPSQGL